MKINKGPLEGIFEIDLDPKMDNRGFFMRTYDDQIFKQSGLHRNWVQENHSYSRMKGTLRGLHFQFSPDIETKLVRVVSGKVFDVFVDLRKGSATFGKWGSIILSAENKKMLYIPRGFAHGMCTLSDEFIMLYKVDNYYAPNNEGSIKWNDPDIGIQWPVDTPILSGKDEKAMSFKEFTAKYGGLAV